MEKSLKVLMVEDQEDDAELILLQLKRGDYTLIYERVDTADGMNAALKKQTWDVVLCDYVLPSFDAMHALALVKEQAPDLPFIIISGNIGEETAVAAMKAGAHDYLMKDNLKRLVPAVEREIQEAEGRRQRKRAEAALRESEDLYRRAIAQADAVPYRRDYQTESFTFMGEGILELAGYAPQEMTPKLWKELVQESLMRGGATGRSIDEAASLAWSGHLDWRSDSRIITQNGETRWVADSSIEVLDGQGKSIGSIGILQDITERKQMEEELRTTNRLLEETLAELQATQEKVIQQERLRALGTLASGIAHDFNNSLAPIVGFSELLLNTSETSKNIEQSARYLEMINTSAKDAAEVVRHLSEFYRLRDKDEIFEPVDLNKMIEVVITLTKPRWKDQAQAEGITIHIESDLQKVPDIFGNEAGLREALTNLIFNAVDAMSEDGQITLRTYQDGDDAVLEVADTGIGMTAEARQLCFDPFFSTKGNLGTGLGLSMVYGIIQRHEGEISVSSRQGVGTTFTIRLPIQSGRQVHGVKKKAEPQLPSLHVLVVDDELLVREMVAQYLVINGHTVELAANGCEGLEKFKVGRFDLVVVDRAMPKMNGDDMAAAIKRVAPTQPVIMLTGFGDLMEYCGEQPAGVDLIVGKPVTLNGFREALVKVMR